MNNHNNQNNFMDVSIRAMFMQSWFPNKDKIQILEDPRSIVDNRHQLLINDCYQLRSDDKMKCKVRLPLEYFTYSHKTNTLIHRKNPFFGIRIGEYGLNFLLHFKDFNINEEEDYTVEVDHELYDRMEHFLQLMVNDNVFSSDIYTTTHPLDATEGLQYFERMKGDEMTFGMKHLTKLNRNELEVTVEKDFLIVKRLSYKNNQPIIKLKKEFVTFKQGVVLSVHPYLCFK